MVCALTDHPLAEDFHKDGFMAVGLFTSKSLTPNHTLANLVQSASTRSCMEVDVLVNVIFHHFSRTDQLRFLRPLSLTESSTLLVGHTHSAVGVTNSMVVMYGYRNKYPSLVVGASESFHSCLAPETGSMTLFFSPWRCLRFCSSTVWCDPSSSLLCTL